jgi:hypothetical protein
MPVLSLLRYKSVSLLILLVVGGVCLQCSGKEKAEIAGEQDVFTKEQREKVDRPLRRIVFQGAEASSGERLQKTVRDDGSIVYHLLVQTESPEALSDAGLPVSSVSGGVATARWTADQIREAVQLSSVRRIEPAGEAQTLQQ